MTPGVIGIEGVVEMERRK
uniref:Uncharacterized protein n=1 Tax=Arundo donax TaxID=35708 RepID=A0A0A9AJZ8_ARUDO